MRLREGASNALAHLNLPLSEGSHPFRIKELSNRQLFRQSIGEIKVLALVWKSALLLRVCFSIFPGEWNPRTFSRNVAASASVAFAISRIIMATIRLDPGSGGRNMTQSPAQYAMSCNGAASVS